METIYVLKLENYQGETSFELFHHKENAERRYNELLNENKDKDEFECYDNDEQAFSFFDPNYNEYSTFISFCESTLNWLFED